MVFSFFRVICPKEEKAVVKIVVFVSNEAERRLSGQETKESGLKSLASLSGD